MRDGAPRVRQVLRPMLTDAADDQRTEHPNGMTADPDDQDIDRCVQALLAARRAGASICPSEVARALRPDDWRPLMPRVRQVAFAMARAGRLEIAQHGERVEPGAPLRGAIRLRRPAQGG